MELRKAERQQAKIKMGIQGPSGSGKTFSALLLAFGLINDWNKIAVIDTENHSSELYSHLGDFNVLSLTEPFSPERFVEAITACELSDIDVIIIDSISHEWEAVGGILDIHSNMAGNSFTNWHKITPRHNAFVQKMLQSCCHIICTIRTKQDYVLSEKNGKTVPEKVGLKSIQRDGMDYEFTIVFDIDIKHNAVASKDRTGLFMDKPPILLGTNTGQKIIEWCNEGDLKEFIIGKVKECVTVLELKDLYNKYPNYQNELIDHFSQKREELEKKNIAIPPKFKLNGNNH